MAPYDRSTMGQIAEQEEDENKKSGASLGVKRKFDEFECPACTAYNPFPDFGNGDEVLCNHCGMSFAAKVDEEGRLKLREA